MSQKPMHRQRTTAQTPQSSEPPRFPTPIPNSSLYCLFFSQPRGSQSSYQPVQLSLSAPVKKQCHRATGPNPQYRIKNVPERSRFRANLTEDTLEPTAASGRTGPRSCVGKCSLTIKSLLHGIVLEYIRVQYFFVLADCVNNYLNTMLTRHTAPFRLYDPIV